MTIEKAIDIIDNLKPNQFTDEEKLRWLSILDGRIKTEIIDTHADASEEEIDTEYNDNTPIVTELLVPYPYDDIYIKWLEAQIDYANGEIAKYNNSFYTFNDAYSAYDNYYNSKHMPKGTKIKFF